jgi:DNA modification methylase
VALWHAPAPRVRIACADWLDAAPGLDRGSIDLLYADPPFNTGRRQQAHAGDFDDAWDSPAAYITWLRARLEATLPTLKPSACLLIHVDWRTSHHVRLLLDDLLGADRFVNHLVWRYGLGGSSPRRFARKHDDILFYCIDPEAYWFEPPRIAATSRRMAGQTKKATDVIDAVEQPGSGADEVLDVPSLNNMASERVGWPTQKPLALLRMLVGACCPPEGVALDPCCGSGTTLVAALQLGRQAIGMDVSDRAIRLTCDRVSRLRSERP